MFKKSILLSTISVCTLLNSPALAENDIVLDAIVVTTTKEEKPVSELAEAIGIVNKEDLSFVSPAHPSDVTNRKAGVHVNDLGGEGHMTSIRQPLTTGAVYLFLEDGIPTRPTGLFNHNALYEINVPQAERIEITKGPGSALYGSDAIGGIINVITPPSPDEPEIYINPEFGSFGFKRMLASVGSPLGLNAGFRANVNLTDNEGWRDESSFSRYSTTGRFDANINDNLKLKSIFSYTHVDQSGVSGLEEDDYLNNPKKNLYHNDVGRRELDAIRFSTEFAYEPDDVNLLTVTPFMRHNEMKLMPSWMLTYDPNDRNYEFQSYGINTKYRRKLNDLNAEIIAGVDFDYTTSQYIEKRIQVQKDGELFVGTTETDRTNYDYDADMIAVSPYIHGEWQALSKLRFSAGLRYDYFRVDYTDNLDASVAEGVGFTNHLRPDSQTISYDSLSPKFGAVWQVEKNLDLYANYRHSFRAPSVGSLFRPGSSLDTDELKPVHSDSFEIGTRGKIADWLNYNVTLYHMLVKDDIVSYIDTISGERKISNAGETEHQGIEIELKGQVTDEWSYQAAFSYTNQEYNDFTAIFGFPATQINFAGNDIGKAPKTLGNLAIQYRPAFIDGLTLEAEWVHVGDYFTDETNTNEYEGHDLFNLRASLEISEQFELYGRIMNITDERYSTYTSNQVGDPDITYRPGLPRRFYVGFRSKF